MTAAFTFFGSTDDADVEALRSRLRRLEALIGHAPIPIAIAHDAECRIITANEALADLLGVTAEANISLTPPPGERPRYRIQRAGRDIPADELPMQFAIANRTFISNDIEILRADGTVRYIQNDVEPLYDASGNVIGCVSVCVDLTERKRAEAMLREADRRKDEFLATLAHELRNPLAPIRNALDILRRSGHDPLVAGHVQAVMERQLHQLIRLTDDLLDVSRIARNKIELRRHRIDLRNVLDSAIETTQPLMDAAGHIFAVDIAATAVFVDADLTRLSQAFANLLHNAVKYTPHAGRIAMRSTLEGEQVLVSVSDTGIGIDASARSDIFEMFMQSSEVTAAARREGLGIGLTLAKRLIELHGGTIDVHSDGPGRGSTFSVRLPAVAAAPPAIASNPLAPTSEPRRVLVAEDLADSAEMLRLMLVGRGHDVRVANDGAQAISIAKQFHPDVALLDLGMPRVDGYEAAREIRRALGTSVVLVALTGWGHDEHRQRTRDAGFDHHLTKPADPDALDLLIASAAAHH